MSVGKPKRLRDEGLRHMTNTTLHDETYFPKGVNPTSDNFKIMCKAPVWPPEKEGLAVEGTYKGERGHITKKYHGNDNE